MTENERRILPCPFCGGDAELTERKFPYIGMLFGVMCTFCDCWCDFRERSREEAIKTWNTRVQLRDADKPAGGEG